MTFIRNHWYDLGVFPIAAATIWLVFGWSEFDTLQKLAFMNFIVIFLHQLEECRFRKNRTSVSVLPHALFVSDCTLFR